MLKQVVLAFSSAIFGIALLGCQKADPIAMTTDSVGNPERNSVAAVTTTAIQFGTVAVAKSNNGKMFCFGVNTANNYCYFKVQTQANPIYTNCTNPPHYSYSKTWPTTDWTSLSSTQILHQLQVIKHSDNKLYLFAINKSNNMIYYKVQTAVDGTTFSSWTQLTSNTGSDFCVVKYPDNSLALFYKRTSDSKLYLKRLVGSTWQTAVVLGGTTTIGTTLHVGTRYDGKLAVFYTNNLKLYSLLQKSDNSWPSSYQTIYNIPQAPLPGDKNITSGVNASNHLEVLFSSGDGIMARELLSIGSTGTGTWGSIYSVYGNDITPGRMVAKRTAINTLRLWLLDVTMEDPSMANVRVLEQYSANTWSDVYGVVGHIPSDFEVNHLNIMACDTYQDGTICTFFPSNWSGSWDMEALVNYCSTPLGACDNCP
jgi:hypothetical protein